MSKEKKLKTEQKDQPTDKSKSVKIYLFSTQLLTQVVF